MDNPVGYLYVVGRNRARRILTLRRATPVRYPVPNSGIGFFLVAIEVPADWTDTYASVVPSVISRDAGGGVLAAISEPF